MAFWNKKKTVVGERLYTALLTEGELDLVIAVVYDCRDDLVKVMGTGQDDVYLQGEIDKINVLIMKFHRAEVDL